MKLNLSVHFVVLIFPISGGRVVTVVSHYMLLGKHKRERVKKKKKREGSVEERRGERPPLGSAFKADQTRLKGTKPRHRTKQPGNENGWWGERRDKGRGASGTNMLH